MAPESTSYPWYSQIEPNEPIQQGDIITDCPVVIPLEEVRAENEELASSVKIYDVIIMSQSCDLSAKKISLVLVCPLYTLTELGERHSGYKTSKMKNYLGNGWIVGYHLLNKCSINGREDYLVVDFKNVYGVPLDFLKNLASSRSNRTRLLPPYREHLSQAFARFFMRVGLPIDIPSFK
jgi:hypothetical protein